MLQTNRISLIVEMGSKIENAPRQRNAEDTQAVIALSI